VSQEDVKMSQESKASGPYELFMVLLSIAVLLMLAADILFDLDDAHSEIVFFVDFAVCIVFFLDFLHSLAWAEDRKRYFLTWGWLDLISSTPAIGPLRLGRAARFIRVLRILRGIRSLRVVGLYVYRNRAQSTLLATVLITAIVIVGSSIAILEVERPARGSIVTGQDALWWAVVTASTVGYGDKVPTTVEGRLIGFLLIVAGLALVSVLTAYVAAWFVGPGEREEMTDLEGIRQEVGEIKQILKALQERDSA